MAKKFDKETLFNDYFATAKNVFRIFETTFQADGVCAQIFGVESYSGGAFQDRDTERAAKEHVRSSEAWQTLSCLYDYAMDGILPSSIDPTDIVIGGAEALSFITTENYGPSGEWQLIVAQGDGRFALDDGEDLTLDKLALLAAVDVRTVRNAISAADLVANKLEGLTFVDNLSARNWLSGRRGFKPTRILTEHITELREISTPVEFGSFLLAQRKKIGLDTGTNKILILHPSVDAKAISEIENGTFKLPLDAVYPLADFYQIDRKQFLGTVMRIFFREELASLSEIINAN